MNKLRKTIAPTKRAHTVVFQCCDPTVPVETFDTDNPVRAKFLYDYILNSEKSEGPGGEWTLTWYEHPTDKPPVIKTMKTDASHLDGEFVYYVSYPDSTVRATESYMMWYVDDIENPS